VGRQVLSVMASPAEQAGARPIIRREIDSRVVISRRSKRDLTTEPGIRVSGQHANGMPRVYFFGPLRRFPPSIGIPLLETIGLCGVASVLHGDFAISVTRRERCTNGRPTVDRCYAKSRPHGIPTVCRRAVFGVPRRLASRPGGICDHGCSALGPTRCGYPHHRRPDDRRRTTTVSRVLDKGRRYQGMLDRGLRCRSEQSTAQLPRSGRVP
jgi:hypothetical protein